LPQAAALHDASIVVDNAATVQSPFAITVKPGVPDRVGRCRLTLSNPHCKLLELSA